MNEWANLLFRWAHVFSAILWVGSTYYFTWLDGTMRRLETKGDKGGVWMVHSGGFYTVVKQKTLGVRPSDVHWFRYEALATFLTGFVLLNLVYYHGGLMVDPIDPKVTPVVASIIGVAVLLVGWIVYDLLVLTPLAKNDVAFGTLAFVLIIATTAGLSQVFSSRATYIHIGALLGTIMVANVWMRILPPQRRMIAAAAKGEPFNEALGAGAKLRSKHNTFIAVPTTVIMISNHFPTATYGNHYAVAVLGGLILVGWGAAALIRRA
ncbi:MAG TPA: urate hydroxylase PuuD [Vicinamibacterales bacterium]|nr:urate hydroxylase PuuD [Vicinamibacterales bacterium]